MRRFVLDLLTVLCLLGLAAVLTLWVRSYVIADDVLESYHDGRPVGGRRRVFLRSAWDENILQSFPGRFDWYATRTRIVERRIGSERPSDLGHVNGWFFFQRTPRGPDSALWRPRGKTWLGLGVWRIDFNLDVEGPRADYSETRSIKGWGVAAPYGFVAALLAVVPAARVVTAVRRGRRTARATAGPTTPVTAAARPAAYGGAGRLAYGLAVAASALLLAITSVAWVRSYTVRDRLGRTTSDLAAAPSPGIQSARLARTLIESNRGRIHATRHVEEQGRGPWSDRPARYELYYWPIDRNPRGAFAPGARVLVDGAGFYWADWHHDAPAARSAGWDAAAPHSAVAVLFALLPAHGLLRAARRAYRRRRGARLGLCAHCGYDLRAGHDRCPECGEPITTGDSPAAATNEAPGV